MGLELLQAGGHHFGQMALFVALRHANGFIELAFAQGASDHRSELTGLFTGGAEGDPAVNHDANRPRRHNKENDYDDLGYPAHLFPQVDGIPPDGSAFVASSCLLKQPESKT